MKNIYTSAIFAGLLAAAFAWAEGGPNTYGVGNTDYGSSNVANQPNSVPPSTTDMSNSSSDTMGPNASGPNSAARNNGAAGPGAGSGATTNDPNAMNNGSASASVSQTDVMGAQQALSQHGFQVTQDGIIGPKTKGAIRQFQAKNGLPETGELDSQTVDMLNQPGSDSGSSATDQPSGL